ncbi:Tox-REase-5 domain-containing protein [Tenacibaculum mesophilum]|uniref:Tox-REase-5 domain-containing protein n=1 Tax=Tenacibaculum mesophilum TaxID=104268 RepID=UPI002493A67B|nr:Tox-REase-5 domain-containing protein [Tenacibaculum mesophilum]
MKKRKKQIANLLKLGVFLFGISLLLWNCEKDVKVDSILENKQHRKYDLSIQEKVTITDEQLLKELRIPLNTTSLYKSTNKQLSKNKTVEVNTNEVAIAKTPAYEVYTFPLKNYDTSYDFQNLAVVKRETKEPEYLLLSYLKDNAPKNPNFPYKVYQQSLGNDLDVVFSEKQAKTQNRGSGENKCFKVRYLPCGCGGNADGHERSGAPCCQGSPTLLREVSCSDGGCGNCPVPEDDTPPATNPDNPDPVSPSGDGGGGGGGGAAGPGGPIYIYEGDEECFSDGTCTPPLYVPTVLDINLNDILTPEQLLFLSQYPSLESEIKGLLRASNNSSEAKKFVEQAIKLDIILDANLEVKTTGKHPDEISDCCPGDCCPNPAIYDNDLIIQEYGIKPVQAAVDATFNVLALISGVAGSKEWVGKRARRIMTEIGVAVPSDVSNEQLAELFQIRKKDGLIIVEYREGFLKSMLSLGLDSLDILSFVSPSKGGGAFLAVKGGGIIAKTKLTEYLRVLAKGQWKTVSESMSDAAKSYQELISGRKWNESFVLNSVKFDGLRSGVLSDAKSGMLNFVNSDGTFKAFFTGKDAIVSQARRQRAAAGDLPIEWHFEHDNVRLAFEKLLTPLGLNIKFTHTRR